MPRKPKAKIEAEKLAAAQALLDAGLDEGDLQQQDEEEVFFSELDEDSSIYITRIETNGDKAKCGKYAWDQLKEDPFEFIRKTWGPGKYKLMRFRPGFGLNGMCGTKTVVIARKLDQPTTGLIPGMQTLEQMQIQMLNQQLQSTQSLLNQILVTSRGPDLGSLLTGLGQFMKPPDMIGQFTAMMQAVNMVKPDDPLQKAKDLLELARTVSPGGGDAAGSSGWMGVAEKFLDKLPLLAASAPKPQPAALPPAASAPTQPRQETEEEMTTKFVAALTLGIETLRERFRAGIAPQPMAAKIIEEGKQDHFNAVIAAVANGTPIESLFGFAPQLTENQLEQQWFEAVYAELKILSVPHAAA